MAAPIIVGNKKYNNRLAASIRALIIKGEFIRVKEVEVTVSASKKPKELPIKKSPRKKKILAYK